MRILFGIPYRDHLEIALNEVQAFENLGIEIDVSNYSNSGKVKGILKSLLLVLKNAINIKRKITKQKTEFIYLNSSFDRKTILRDSITVFIIKLFNRGSKVVLKIHGSDENVVKSKSLLKSYLFKKVTIFLLLSKEEKNNFLSAGLGVEKIGLTFNPINKNIYKVDLEFKQKLGVFENTFVLLFVGRFIMEKGILDLINACLQLENEAFNYTLVCLGSGPLEKEVSSIIKKNGLSRIKLLGHIPENETKYYYSNCDVLILPTYHCEGFPMAVFQAVAAGKAVITTNIRAASDYLEEYKNCLWINKKDPKDIYDKVIFLSQNKDIMNEMGNNNLLLANDFTAEKNAQNFLEKYISDGNET